MIMALGRVGHLNPENARRALTSAQTKDDYELRALAADALDELERNLATGG